MKKITLLFSFIYSSFALQAQSNCSEPLATHFTQGNNIQASVKNSGSLFYDLFFGNTFISTDNNENLASSIFFADLWIGAVDPAKNLRLSANTYSEGAYNHGPITSDFTTDSLNCINWNRFWMVTDEQIEAHQADFADNGVIDAPIEEIFSWPASGNINFESIEGFPLPESDASLAPFFDLNGDGNYQPADGEFPLPNNVSENAIPQEITYCLFNDISLNEITSPLDPLQVQIGQTTYAYACTGQTPLNNTLFVSYQMVNKGLETLDSMFVGMCVDLDLGCPFDDFVGSDSIRNAFFAYNSDNVDGITGDLCDGTLTFGENPPAQAVTYLNQPINFLTYHNSNNGNGNPNTVAPSTGVEYFRYLTGSWRDGSPLHYGGDGFQEGTEPTTHAFPDDPNNPNGWSMQTVNLDALDRRVVGSTKIGVLQPGQTFSVDMAFTFVREDGFSNFENVTAMYDQIDEVKAAYDNQFAQNCMSTAVSNVAAKDHNFKIFPNPTTEILTVEFTDFTIKTIRVIDVTGKVILVKKGHYANNIQLNLNQLSKGIYFLQMENDSQRFYEKISIQ